MDTLRLFSYHLFTVLAFTLGKPYITSTYTFCLSLNVLRKFPLGYFLPHLRMLLPHPDFFLVPFTKVIIILLEAKNK